MTDIFGKPGSSWSTGFPASGFFGNPSSSWRTVYAGQINSAPPPNGTWVVYEGHYYMYDNGKWFDNTGNQAWIPVWFTTSPFENFVEGSFNASAVGLPWPAWGTGNQVADDPIALATHIEQMRGVLVMGYLSANGAMSIPVRDHDLGPDGQVIYGDSLLDPSLPPMVSFRFNANSTSDIVNTPSSTTATWASYSVGARGIVSSDDAQWSVTLMLEKDPQPHWVLKVANTDNSGGTSSRTFACWLVGVGAPIDYTAYDWEVGSGGTSGHYHVYLPFDAITSSRQDFITDGSYATTARAKFMQRTLFWNEEYIAAASNTVLYLTDTGATGGGDVFASQFPPCVWVFGDDTLDHDRGTTVANLRMSSWGIGFVVDGYLTPEDAALGVAGRSIQTPNADEYCSVDYVGTYGASNEWGVNVYNLCNTNNINGNPRAPVSGSGNRHFVAMAFGPDAATASAAAGKRVWSKQTAPSTMSTAVLRERALWVARLNLTGGYGACWWTDDGTSTGTNLFSTSHPVCVCAISSDPKKPQAWTIDGHYGPMIRPDVTGSDGQFMFLTAQSGGRWITEVVMGGFAALGLASQGDNADRQVILYAMGASA